MNVAITFRHVEPTEALKETATQKVTRLQKFLRQPMTARVTLSLEKLEHSVEVQISSGGQRYEAKEVSEDMYASIDAVCHKLERQISHSKGVAGARRRQDAEGAAVEEVAVGTADH